MRQEGIDYKWRESKIAVRETVPLGNGIGYRYSLGAECGLAS